MADGQLLIYVADALVQSKSSKLEKSWADSLSALHLPNIHSEFLEWQPCHYYAETFLFYQNYHIIEIHQFSIFLYSYS